MEFKANLSYNPIDSEKIATVLAQYKGRHHREMIIDFEQQIKILTGAKYVVALNTGTAAIHLALRSLGITAGDHVIVSTFTYVASVNPILYQGAIPVFVDSEADTWNMDPALLKLAIGEMIQQNKKPKAIVLVHTYGIPAKLDEILDIAKFFNIPVVEDAAEAIGSYYKGKHVGTFGAVGLLSFNSNKIVTTYGGGAVLVNTKDDYNRILFWATQSCEELLYYEHKEIGYNYRMSPINAAVGLSEWQNIENKLGQRKIVFEGYRQALLGLPGFQFPQENSNSKVNHWFTTILIDRNLTRNHSGSTEVLKQLKDRGIEARRMWNPMHRQPIFQSYACYLNGVSDQLFEMGLCLPSDQQAKNHQTEIIQVIQDS